MANTQTLLSLGYPQAMIQSQVYSMPNKTVMVSCNAGLTFSNDVAQALGPVTITAVTNAAGFISSYAFVSTAATNAVITCKPY